MPVKIIKESESGAYLDITPEFLKCFKIIERNPNFDVFEKDSIRLVLAKCSRVVDNSDNSGRYGINLYRRLPTLEEAFQYWQRLPDALQDRQYTGYFAFAAKDEADYAKKAAVYQAFYSFVFGPEPKIVYVAPHCGDVKREPDQFVRNPKGQIDKWTAGVTALGGLKDKRVAMRREVVFIHQSNDDFKSYPAVIDIGDCGLMDKRQLAILEQLLADLNQKYKERVNKYASVYKERVFQVTKGKLASVLSSRGTLEPNALDGTVDGFHVSNIFQRLEECGFRLSKYQLSEIEAVLVKAIETNEPQLKINHMFTGRKVGLELLKLPEKIQQGILDNVIQMECSKTYLEFEPDLIAEIIVQLARSNEAIQNELY